jgi:hypothetical protein
MGIGMCRGSFRTSRHMKQGERQEVMAGLSRKRVPSIRSMKGHGDVQDLSFTPECMRTYAKDAETCSQRAGCT